MLHHRYRLRNDRDPVFPPLCLGFYLERFIHLTDHGRQDFQDHFMAGRREVFDCLLDALNALFFNDS